MTIENIDRKALRVMLVDDDHISAFIYRKIIEKGGLLEQNVEVFMKGNDALTYLERLLDRQSDIPDILLLDINMPQMNGWQFLDEYENRIRPHLHQPVKLCMLSSSVYENDIQKAFSYSFVNDYIAKPLTTEKLDNFLYKHFS